jgi:four helix bundle protein
MYKDFEFRKTMQNRTKQFALRAIRLFKALPATDEARIIGKQFLRAATSVGSNYRAACRARSSKEFYSKLSIVIEESDESMFWLEILGESGIMKMELLQDLINEADEIIRILVAARKTISNNSQLK